MSKAHKRIRVFWSPLTWRFYASQHYKDCSSGDFEITGKKYDVTDDIGSLINEYKIEFIKRKAQP